MTISGTTTFDYLVYAEGSGQAYLEFSAATGLGTSTAVVTDRYLNALDQVFADYEATTNTRAVGFTNVTSYAGTVWILGDHQGTAKDLMWYSGGTYLVTHRVFNAFGAIEVQATNNGVSPAVGTNVAYAGALIDPYTGLQDDWHRWYDTAVGQFICPDPCGFTAGDMNTYRYVNGAPMTGTDPSGLGSWFNRGE